MVEVSGSVEETDAQKRMIFLANKTSNNINQIAKKLNQAYTVAKWLVSETTSRS